jgi:perosamine synthetase
MTNLQAAIGCAQLENIENHIRIKREIGKTYQEGLSDLVDFQLPLSKTEYAENIYWVFGLIAESQDKCDAMVNKLSASRIGTRPFFWCMHEQPVFQKMGLFKNEQYPNAERMARNGFYLPSGLGLMDNEIEIIISNVI